MTKGFHKRVMQVFSERLRTARLNAGFQHAKDFADALGVEAPTYRYWERGQAQPDLTTLARICILLRVEPNYLLPFGIDGEGKAAQDTAKSAA